MEQSQWVDFKAVKAAVSIQQVLDHYGVNWLRRNGDELRGRCPIHKGEGDRTFHANVDKNAFHCFSCKARGNVLDLVAAMEQCSVRDAALKLQEWFQVTAPAGERAEEKPPVPSAAKEPSPAPVVINPPLSFQLRVDPAHAYGLSRGLTKETFVTFGAGFCLSKGTFAGRFIIPLHNPEGQLVGYAGRSIDGGEPKYLFPSSEKGFHKSRLLFNRHRITATTVVLVEGFFGCMKLHEAGIPSVALLGSSLSEEQEALLCAGFERVVLMFDGDDAGRHCTEDCLKRLARRVFVKVLDLPGGQQPDLITSDAIKGLLGSL